MRNYKYVPSLVLFLVAIILFMFSSVPSWVPIVLLVLGIILIFVAGWGAILFSRANKLVAQRKEGWAEKSSELYERSLKKGLPDQFSIVAATMVLQYGDIEIGKSELEKLTKSKTLKIRSNAYNCLGMYYWAKKDVKKAIELSLKARELGLKDRNLYINLCTYYIYLGDIHSFRLMFKECFSYKLQSVPIVDLHAQYLILSKNYERAGGFLKTIFDTESPNYADPFLHYALIFLHYGKVDTAIKYLKEAVSKCQFSNTSLIPKDFLEKAISLLEDSDTKWRAAIAFSENEASLMNGLMPEIKERLESVPVFDEIPNFKTESITKEDLDEVDENDIDTSITQEDEEWLKSHSS